MDDWERRQKLEEALRDAVQQRNLSPAEARTARRGDRARNPGVTIALVLVGWGCIAWIWLARPAFLFGPTDPPPPSAEVREARLRFAMFLERSRVEAFVQRRGRLPTTLAEAGPVEAGVSYDRTSSGYALHGTRDSLSLLLTSAMNPDSFLGRSLEVIE
jgi:hypothetical protein